VSDIESSGAAFTVTLKLGGGFDAPWIVVRGDDPQQLIQRLQGLHDYSVAAKVANVAREAQALYTGSSRFDVQPVDEPQHPASRYPAPQQQTRPAQGSWPPGIEPYRCKHGEMIYREGQKNDGSVWRGAFCPAPKNDPDQCKVRWINTRGR